VAKSGACLVGFAAAALALGCHRGPQKQVRPPTQVVVEPALVKAVPLDIFTVGTAVPVNTITVRAHVSGTLEHVLFREGDEVRAGQLIFQIDARPFEAALASARATLSRDEAQLANAEIEAQRYARLLPSGVVSQSDHDARMSAAQSLRATVLADKAAIDTAQLNLEYTTIRSPIAGLTGSLQVNAGNLVRADDTPLVILRQMRPMDMAFTVPATDLPAVRASQARQPLLVRATPRGTTTPAEGRLFFVDNTVDPSTGTVLMKARFPNIDATLWPGQFANVQLRLGMRERAVVIPARAIAPGQGGERTYVVGDDLVAQSRLVRTGPRDGEEIVVEEGLAPGERVVVDGLLGLAPGTRVEVQPATRTATPPRAPVPAPPPPGAAPAAAQDHPALGMSGQGKP